jgi:hypothetical protein
VKKRNLSNAINNLRKHNTSSTTLRPSKLINSTFNQDTLNNILQYSNKDILDRNNFINNHKGYHSYNNKVIKINRKNNKTYNENISNSSINLINRNNCNNRTLNYNDFIYQKENSANYNSSNVSDSENELYYNRNNSILRNYNSYNSNGSLTKKHYELKDEKMKLIQKMKTKPMSLNGSNFYNTKNIKSSHIHEQTNKNPQNNMSNKIKNHFMKNNKNNKVINSALNHNMPIRINYYNKYLKENGINLKKENSKNCHCHNIQYKIDDMKRKIGFEGNNDEFIEYIKILKKKADITELVINMFNNGKNIDENGIKNCFLYLEHLMSNKIKEDKNLLNIYQYLIEQLLQVNNINKNGILNNN